MAEILTRRLRLKALESRLTRSSDGAGLLPGDYRFTAADHGSHNFQAMFTTLGAQTITATDHALAGSASTTVAERGVATHFAFFVPPVARKGDDFGFTVVALDA